MQITKTQNYNPNFNAKLVLSWRDFKHYKKNANITDFQIRVMEDKFERATEDIEGTLKLDFGEYYPRNPYMTKEPNITYINGKNHTDKMPIALERILISSNDEFIDKLVATLNIFKMRERNMNKIEDLVKKADQLALSTRASSLGAAETIFPVREWRNREFKPGFTTDFIMAKPGFYN